MNETVMFTYGSENEDFYLERIRRTAPFQRTNHMHPNYEIYYLFAGQRAYFIKDRSYLIVPGDLVFIRRNEVHNTSGIGEPGHERVVINFSERYFGAGHHFYRPYLFRIFEEGRHVLQVKPADRPRVEQLFSRMIGELAKQELGYDLAVKQLLVELLLFAARSEPSAGAHTIDHPNPLHRKISDIVR